MTGRRRLDDEAKKRAEDLAGADRRKDEFLSMLSHELRNPLAPIMTALSILRREPSENRVLQQAQSTLERQVRTLTRLVDDLLDVTRIRSGKVQLRTQPVDLALVLQRAVETSRRSSTAGSTP